MSAPDGVSAPDDLVLSIESGKGDGHAIRLPRDSPRFVVGNRKSANISIRDPWISWDHAALEWKDGELWLEDLKSANGTYVNRARIERTKLAAGDRISFGKTGAAIVLASSLGERKIESASRAGAAGLEPEPESKSAGCMSVVLFVGGVMGAGWLLA